MSHTVPPQSTPKDHVEWDIERRMRGERVDMRIHRPDFTPDTVNYVFKWCAIVLGGIATTAIVQGCNEFSDMKKQMAVLVSRPVSVSKEKYDDDQQFIRGRLIEHSEALKEQDGRMRKLETELISTRSNK